MPAIARPAASVASAAMLEQELKRRVSDALGKSDFVLAERLCRDAEESVAAEELLLIRGVLASARGDQDSAKSYLKRAHQVRPDRGDIAYNYGVVLHQAGCLTEAVQAWGKAVTHDPQNAAAWVNLALGTLHLGNEQAALDFYRRGLIHHSSNRDLLYNYANLLLRLGKLAESEAIYKTLLKSHSHDAIGWINYGKLLKTAQRFAELEDCYRRAIALAQPDSAPLANFNLANLLLKQGRWREGFAAYEWRLRLPDSVANPWGLARWNDAVAKGSRILLWSDQGQGDAIMFLRFAPLFAQKGYRLFAFVQSSLRALAATAPGIEAAFSPLDEPQAMDTSLPLCSLPHVLGLESPDIWTAPYLSASQSGVVLLGEKPSAGRRIGIVWAGNPNHANDAHRSLALVALEPLFELPGLEWFSLQVGERVAELATSPYRDRVRDLSPHLSDFSATAAVLAGLDLLISVDSAPAHLAGALGTPVWTPLPAVDTDWRWCTGGDTTFWYPSMRLFRQTRAGDWSPVISTMADVLKSGPWHGKAQS